MATIYLTDEVVEELDKARRTPMGDIDRSEYLLNLLKKTTKR